MIQFRSDFVVKAVPDGCCGSDRLIACAAWADDPDALPPERNDSPTGWGRVIRSMLSVKPAHTGPFEQGRMTVFIEAPGVVWWQLTRHRFMAAATEDFSFNLESGRYKVLDGVFYEPPDGRPILEPPDFRPIRPKLVEDADLLEQHRHGSRATATAAWEQYERSVGLGVAREVARFDLPNWRLYCSGYVGGVPSTWLTFFSKRKADPAVRTFPQFETEKVCEQCEKLFAARWPLTYEAFVLGGRVAP